MSRKKKVDSLYRTIKVNFWSDRKVQDEMTTEDKFMLLYLLTNERTDLTGCYEISFKKIAYDTGYEIQQCKKIFSRLTDLGIIKFDETTSEVLIVNWAKHNWIPGGYREGVQQRCKKIKSAEFSKFIADQYKSIYNVDIKVPIIKKEKTEETESTNSVNK